LWPGLIALLTTAWHIASSVEKKLRKMRHHVVKPLLQTGGAPALPPLLGRNALRNERLW
jgi:hypothetical protein